MRLFIRAPIEVGEFLVLQKEFNRTYEIYEWPPGRPIPPEEWRDVEVLYSNELSHEELEAAHQLRWIHLPTSSFEGIPLPTIRHLRDVLVSYTKTEGQAHQVAEYCFGGYLAWIHGLLGPSSPDNPPSMETIRGKTLLQIGIGEVGGAITQLAKEAFGMRTWTVQEKPSFHPYCDRVYTYEELHSLLSSVDLLVITPTPGWKSPIRFAQQQFDLLNPKAVIIALYSSDLIDLEALHTSLIAGRFRGVILDSKHLPEMKERSSFENERLLITPGVTLFPEEEAIAGFRQFRANLRRYIRGDFQTLQHCITSLSEEIN